jgi:hypothetical protein
MSTSIDLNRTTGLIDLGTHTFKISEKSKEDIGPSGDPCWYIICKVISQGDNIGKELLHTVSLGERSRWKMDEFLDGIGAARKGKATLETFIGRTFRATVGLGDYQGKPKSIIEAFIPVSDSQPSFDELPSQVADFQSALPADVVGEDPEGETSRRGRFS